jgi:hypothetical protein
VIAVALATLLVHITGSAAGRNTQACFLRLDQHVVGGGRMTYCLQDFSGAPGPNAVVRDRGVMTFVLPHRTIRASVSIVQRFGPDGRHATQALRGTVAGGGTITGGGSVVEDTPGHIARSDLRYRIRR